MPKVSFILPAYKRRYLRESIASILGQSCSDFEVVVVDDCSPEDLKSVVNEFHDERLTYHRNEVNIGGKDLVAAWNHAMEYARGEWCVLASDDDVWLPDCLKQLLRLVEKYPHCDLFHARCACIDANGKWIDIAPTRREFESQIEMAYERGVRNSCQQAPDFMFRTDAWRRIGGFVNFPVAWYTDDATWISLAKNGCAHTADVTFCFRHSGINLSSCQDALVIRKVEAGSLFLEWMRRLIPALSPETAEERYMLSALEDGIMKQVKGLILIELAETRSFRIWWKALRHPMLNAYDRHEAIYKRYPFVLFLRSLLPR